MLQGYCARYLPWFEFGVCINIGCWLAQDLFSSTPEFGFSELIQRF